MDSDDPLATTQRLIGRQDVWTDAKHDLPQQQWALTAICITTFGQTIIIFPPQTVLGESSAPS